MATATITFECSFDGDMTPALAELESRIPPEHSDLVTMLIGDWYETALDDLVFRVFRFPTNAGIAPDAYVAEARAKGIYRPLTYEFAATYPDIGRIEARFTC